MYNFQAVWKDKFGSVSYYLKLIEQSQKAGVEVAISTDCNQKASESKSKEPSKAMSWLLENCKSSILNGTSMPLMTLFTSWNDSPSKHLLHNATVKNWLSLRPFIIPVLFTNESALATECESLGWEVLPISSAAADGIPVLKYMYRDVMERYNTSFYAFSNGDILFTERLLETLIIILNTGSLNLSEPTLIVGQRTNVENVTLEEGSTWENIAAVAKNRGKLFTGWAEDFFVTTRSYPWNDMPEVVIGRRAYDNWLVYNARKSHFSVIDATKTTLAVHQTDKGGNFEGHGHKNGDYNHNLLVKMYKRIKYNAGVIECIEKYTKYENNVIVVKSRTLPKACTV